MTYIPPRQTGVTVFPEEAGLDLDTTLQQIEEIWRDCYPALAYLPVNKKTTPVADASTLTGEAGSTRYDPLWREAVDPTLTTWAQGQGTGGTQQVADVEVYYPAVTLNIQVQPVNAEGPDLKKYGFDDDDRRVGLLLCTIPVSMLDKASVTCRAGDLVKWEGDSWVVLKPRLSGYYFNTNLRLYAVLLCERYRHGS